MNIEAKIVGFDKSSELMASESEIPLAALPKVREIAQVPDTDPDLLGSYPLDAQQVKVIAELLHLSLDPERDAFFLEAC